MKNHAILRFAHAFSITLHYAAFLDVEWPTTVQDVFNWGRFIFKHFFLLPRRSYQFYSRVVSWYTFLKTSDLKSRAWNHREIVVALSILFSKGPSLFLVFIASRGSFFPLLPISFSSTISFLDFLRRLSAFWKVCCWESFSWHGLIEHV